MPRRRANPLNLPPRVYFYRGQYRFDPKGEKPINLGPDLAEALKRHAVELQARQYTASERDTVGWLLDWYIANIRIAAPDNTERTIAEKTDMLPRLKAALGHIPLRLLRPFHVREYLDLGVAQGRAVRANREKAMLSHACTVAVGKGWIDINPCLNVTRNKERRRERIISDDEMHAVLAKCSVPMRCLAWLIYRTLQRPGDIIKWTARDNVITKDGQTILRNRQGKTGKVVDIAVTPEIQALLDELRADREAAARRRAAQKHYDPTAVIDITEATRPLIRSRFNQGFTEQGIKANWNKACQAAGVTDFGIYDMKSRGATDMYEDGVPIEQISHLCGHNSVTTTETYIKQHLRQTVQPNRRKVG